MRFFKCACICMSVCACMCVSVFGIGMPLPLLLFSSVSCLLFWVFVIAWVFSQLHFWLGYVRICIVYCTCIRMYIFICMYLYVHMLGQIPKLPRYDRKQDRLDSTQFSIAAAAAGWSCRFFWHGLAWPNMSVPVCQSLSQSIQQSVHQNCPYFVFFSHATLHSTASILSRRCLFWITVAVDVAATATSLLCMYALWWEEMVAERGEGLIHILAQVIKYLTVATMKATTKVRAAGERKAKTSADRCTESLIYAIIGNSWAIRARGSPWTRFCNFNNYALFGNGQTENVFARVVAVKVTGDRNGQRRKSSDAMRRVAVNTTSNDTHTCRHACVCACLCVVTHSETLGTWKSKRRVNERTARGSKFLQFIGDQV